MLFDAVNSMDLSLMPKLSLLERHLLQASDNKDLFVEKFEQIVQMRIAEDRKGQVGEPFDASKSPPKPQEVSRAGTKAHIEGQSVYSVPRDTHEFETKVMYKGIPIPVKVPTAIMPETVGDFSLVKLIQNFSEPHAKSPQPFTIHPHLTTNGPNTHPIMVLVNALLTQKRIIFLGYNLPSGEVAEAVLAACALASGGLLRGFTRHAFPYTDLTKIDDLLKVPGFIAGVTNPTFEMHPEWWDLLCDLPSGRMKISSKVDQAPVTEGLVYFQQQNPTYASMLTAGGGAGGGSSSSSSSMSGDLTGDVVFMNDILKSISARLGERVIRAKWRDWVVKFTRISAAFEESVYGASALHIGGDEAGHGAAGQPAHGYVWVDEAAKQKELAGNVHRIEGWRNTRSYYSYIQVSKAVDYLALYPMQDGDPPPPPKRNNENYFSNQTQPTPHPAGPSPTLPNPAPEGPGPPPHARPTAHAAAHAGGEPRDLPVVPPARQHVRRDLPPAVGGARVACGALLPGPRPLPPRPRRPCQDGRPRRARQPPRRRRPLVARPQQVREARLPAHTEGGRGCSAGGCCWWSCGGAWEWAGTRAWTWAWAARGCCEGECEG